MTTSRLHYHIPAGHVLVNDSDKNYVVPGKQFGRTIRNFLAAVESGGCDPDYLEYVKRVKRLPGLVSSRERTTLHFPSTLAVCSKKHGRDLKRRLNRIARPLTSRV